MCPELWTGDTIVIGDTKIRLESIDAPESDQVCLEVKGKRWTCGIEARDRLAEHIGKRPIDCAPSGSDAYGRTLAICRVDGEDLNGWLVRQGWALAFVRYSKAYVPDEDAARVAKRGIWSGAFVRSMGLASPGPPDCCARRDRRARHGTGGITRARVRLPKHRRPIALSRGTSIERASEFTSVLANSITPESICTSRVSVGSARKTTQWRRGGGLQPGRDRTNIARSPWRKVPKSRTIVASKESAPSRLSLELLVP